MDADVIGIGAGLAGLVAAAEVADAGKRVILLDQEPEQSLGGQAFWSFGGLFLVGSPEQRRMGIRDSIDLAWQDWLGSAGFDRAEDEWPRRWAEAYVHFAAGEKRAWLRAMGHRLFPGVGWGERGGGAADGHRNSVPPVPIPRGTPAGGRVINPDRMWHYTEGLRNWDPVWPNHGIRILPGPSSLWLDATGKRLPAPCFPGFDTLSTLAHITATGYDHSWFILTQKIIE